MGFKLVVRSFYKGSDKEIVEYLCTKPVIRIGRGEANDIPISGARRLVSGKHAEIRSREGQLFLVDVGSRNGTRLNGKRLSPGEEYPLNKGDEIAVGDFMIQFFSIEEKPSDPNIIERPADTTAPVKNIIKEAEELFEDLNRAYWDNRDRDHQERISSLTSILRESVSKRERAGAQRLLALVSIRFSEPEYQFKEVLESSCNEKVECSPEEFEAYQTAYSGVSRIAERYLDNLEKPLPAKSVGDLIERLDQILSVMLTCLSDAIKGRREFQHEFEVEATQILSWRPNMLKLAEGAEEIGRSLLDWRKDRSKDLISSELKEVFTDLALHQMGLMAGFKECLRGLLQQLDPASFEAKGRLGNLTIGPFKIKTRFPPFVNLKAWKYFKERYQELLEQEVKTFETILGPCFAKGYLSVQKKKPF